MADHYQVTKRAVVNLAVRERWQERVEELERQARQSANEKALETLEKMNERHLKMLKVVQSRALEALKIYSLVGECGVTGARFLDSPGAHPRRARRPHGDERRGRHPA